MKPLHLLQLTLLSFLLFACNAQPENPVVGKYADSVEDHELSGWIEQVNVFSCSDYSREEVDALTKEAEGCKPTRTLQFDEQGRLVQQSALSIMGPNWTTVVYNYDEHGNPLEIIAQDEQARPLTKAVYTYNEKQKRTSLKNMVREGGEYILLREESWDQANKTGTAKVYDEQGILAKEAEMKLSNSWPAFYHWKNPIGEDLGQEWLSYDKDGTLWASNYKTPTEDGIGDMTRWLQNEYDENGNLRAASWENPMTGRMDYKYVYNDSGLLITEQPVLPPFIKEGEPEGFITDYEYFYDEQGNWIKRIKFLDGRLSEVLIREIVYY